jgi:tartrate dehydratase beta subunit/fumarate hydratase class I family protein
LTERDIKDSNRVLLNGIPLEDIYNLEVKEAPCATCSDLVGREVCCRILVRENTETEEVPVEWIKEGVYLAIGERPSA